MQTLAQYDLIDISEKHKELIFFWRNSDYVRRNMYMDRLITKDEHDKWFDGLQKGNRIIAKLFVYQELPLGFVNFTNIDLENGKCSWGFYIGEKEAPPRSGQVMGFLSLNLIFDGLNLRKVCSEILDFNTRSYYFHKKLGFIEEGKLRKHVYRNNRYADVILMALFKEKWLLKRAELLNEWGEYRDE